MIRPNPSRVVRVSGLAFCHRKIGQLALGAVIGIGFLWLLVLAGNSPLGGCCF